MVIVIGPIVGKVETEFTLSACNISQGLAIFMNKTVFRTMDRHQ